MNAPLETRYVLRDLPGIVAFERVVNELDEHLSDWAPERESAERTCASLAEQLFGITDEAISYEDQIGLFDNEEAAAVLAEGLGWDISNALGERLECFQWLMGPLIYATRGFAGQLPDPSLTASVDTWATGLTAEAGRWRDNHRSSQSSRKEWKLRG